jgi:hypothetical protein
MTLPLPRLTTTATTEAIARKPSAEAMLAGRNGTLRQIFREASPQMLARSLGITPATALKHAALAGADWTAYAADRAPLDGPVRTGAIRGGTEVRT